MNGERDGTANAAAQWYFTSDDVVLLPLPLVSPQLIIGRLEPAELLALLTKLGPTVTSEPRQSMSKMPMRDVKQWQTKRPHWAQSNPLLH